jgi:hypothetical protein
VSIGGGAPPIGRSLSLDAAAVLTQASSSSAGGFPLASSSAAAAAAASPLAGGGTQGMAGAAMAQGPGGGGGGGESVLRVHWVAVPKVLRARRVNRRRRDAPRAAAAGACFHDQNRSGD